MIVRMSMVRKTITLPEEVAAEVEQRADGNFSAYVAALLEHQIAMMHADELIATHEAEHGPIPDEAIRRIDEQMRQIEEEEGERRGSPSTPAS